MTQHSPRNSGPWAHPPRKCSHVAFTWWLRIVSAAAFIGFAVFAADRALPGIAATAIEAERQAELFRQGF